MKVVMLAFFISLHTKQFASCQKIHKKQIRGHGTTNQKILLLSVDGLRWDFIQKYKNDLPSMTDLVTAGVRAEYVENVFPTNTYPNLYSIVTGLYPGNHGIIDNQMYDPKTDQKFSMLNSTDPKWWNEAEPIWLTNQRQGHKSGVCYYPGFNVKIKEKLPTYTCDIKHYRNPVFDDGKSKPVMQHKERIDLTLHWLQQPGVTFTGLYIEDVDELNHEYGTLEKSIDQPEVKIKLKQFDEIFSYLNMQLRNLHLNKKVNVIIIGDHGSTDVTNERVIRLINYIDIKKFVKLATGMSFVSIYPKSGQLKKIYDKLHDVNPNMKVYLKEHLPENLHIKHNVHTAPLIILPKQGWIIDTGFEKNDYLKIGSFHRGEHGYVNKNRDMNPGFFAFGPCFKTKKMIKKIRIIDLYPMMCEIIKIKPNRNDGSLDAIKSIMSSKCLIESSNVENGTVENITNIRSKT